ncbi:hypothetical protein NQ318_001801, partial [Aromia moschata]
MGLFLRETAYLIIRLHNVPQKLVRNLLNKKKRSTHIKYTWYNNLKAVIFRGYIKILNTPSPLIWPPAFDARLAHCTSPRIGPSYLETKVDMTVYLGNRTKNRSNKNKQNRCGTIMFPLQPYIQAKSLTFNEKKCRKITGRGNVRLSDEDS